MDSFKVIYRGCAITLLTVYFSGSVLARDPFWPLGYEGVVVVKPVKDSTAPKISNQDVPARKRVVSADDWTAARKLVQLTGFASAGGRQVAFMNNKSYRHGDKLTFVNDGILFTWRVDILGERNVNLVQVEAVVQ
jgi:hypothetical protein